MPVHKPICAQKKINSRWYQMSKLYMNALPIGNFKTMHSNYYLTRIDQIGWSNKQNLFIKT